MWLRHCLLGLALCSCWIWAGEVGIAARVNDAEISNFRLERYLSEFLAAQGRSLGAIRDPRTYQRLRFAALDELIDKELLLQLATQRGLIVDDEALQAHYDQVRGAFRNARDFSQRLEYAGFDDASYREYLRREQLARRMLEQLIEVVAISEDEVDVFLQQNPSAPGRSEQNRQHIREQLMVARRAEAARAVLTRLRTENRIELFSGSH